MISTFERLIDEEKDFILDSVDEALFLLDKGEILYFDCSDGFLAVYKESYKDYGLIIGQHHPQSYDFGPAISEEHVMSMVHSSIINSNTQNVFSLPRNPFFLIFLEAIDYELVNQVV
jgi:hypothetical protein